MTGDDDFELRLGHVGDKDHARYGGVGLFHSG
jgi:hypothetical protein